MSVHWKPNAAEGNCVHCGRITASGRGCVCPESSARSRRQAERRDKEFSFWDHDHFGLPSGVLEVR